VYRGRFAPSPTGLLHLGHARTYLVAWLRARDANGSVLLRIEDLDSPRIVPGAEAAIARDLEWLGLAWDEPPIRQSERVDRYEAAIDRLRSRGFVYECTCSRREIGIASAPHGEGDLGPRYPGTCRERPSHPGRPAAVRFRAESETVRFEDAVFGERALEIGGDFVLRRADGVFAYQLAAVVDDAATSVTEVVRGADLLTSTPRQIALYRALGLEPPSFLHVPLVLDENGERLSKRHRATAIAELRDAGTSAEEIVGRLAASLGLVPERSQVSPRDLLGRFDPARISTAATLLESGPRAPS
jgi:glutamyl-tRNA synthetase